MKIRLYDGKPWIIQKINLFRMFEQQLYAIKNPITDFEEYAKAHFWKELPNADWVQLDNH